MDRSHGSAAAELLRSAPESALRETVRRCARRLEHAARLALLEAEGPEPLDAARYLTETVSDVGADLRLLRAALRTRQDA